MYIYLELRTIKLRNYLVSLLPLLTLECLYYAVVLESANFWGSNIKLKNHDAHIEYTV